ncbi:hypothetical protein L1887_06967 [Cichorium endivia]|nr:hypothetical protein L1887_06967 [Cichorium endivia]
MLRPWSTFQQSAPMETKPHQYSVPIFCLRCNRGQTNTPTSRVFREGKSMKLVDEEEKDTVKTTRGTPPSHQKSARKAYIPHLCSHLLSINLTRRTIEDSSPLASPSSSLLRICFRFSL